MKLNDWNLFNDYFKKLQKGLETKEHDKGALFYRTLTQLRDNYDCFKENHSYFFDEDDYYDTISIINKIYSVADIIALSCDSMKCEEPIFLLKEKNGLPLTLAQLKQNTNKISIEYKDIPWFMKDTKTNKYIPAIDCSEVIMSHFVEKLAKYKPTNKKGK